MIAEIVGTEGANGDQVQGSHRGDMSGGAADVNAEVDGEDWEHRADRIVAEGRAIDVRSRRMVPPMIQSTTPPQSPTADSQNNLNGE